MTELAFSDTPSPAWPPSLFQITWPPSTQVAENAISRTRAVTPPTSLLSMSMDGSGPEPTTTGFLPLTGRPRAGPTGAGLESKLECGRRGMWQLIAFFRKGEPQPDNYEGIKEGPINAENNIGITIEGLQEFHDEACLAVLNNKYNDGVVWHDVACHFR